MLIKVLVSKLHFMSFHRFRARLAVSRYRMLIVWSMVVGIFCLLALLGYLVAIDKSGYFHRYKLSHHFESDVSYYYLPTVTLSTGGGDGGGGAKAPRLRMQIGLGVATKDMDVLAGYEPRIIEKINDYMIKLRPSDVERADLASWLRGELLIQVNSSGVPFPVDNLYFMQLVVM
jgi:hypothetical protein